VVVDFSWVVAGPWCTQFMGLMGAEVIKVESSVHTDVNRRLPPAADGILDTERSGLWQGLNLNKKSVTLNLKQPAARDLVLDLVRGADVVVENFSFGQLEKFGLSYERFQEVKHDIIMVSSAGLGRTGPYQRYVTFGPPLTAYTGLASITGQEGGRPERGIGGIWCDHQSGLTSFFGILAALEHRERTGEGQFIEYSMAETVMSQLPEAFLEYGCDGAVPGPRGNSDPAACPHSVYRARGEDCWVAIVAQDDAAWEALRGVVQGPDWWSDAALETAAGRLARRPEIDAAVAAWTRGRDAAEIAASLQAAGVSAAPVLNIRELMEDPTLAERGFWLEQDHPEVGKRVLAGIGWTADFMTPLPVQHAPLLGEHNWEIFVDRLGVSPERFADLVAEGVIV
jgi:crotonobetainyl-CoA:carnitine CoA-transferase CaiB-like acyl-CoA transferase